MFSFSLYPLSEFLITTNLCAEKSSKKSPEVGWWKRHQWRFNIGAVWFRYQRCSLPFCFTWARKKRSCRDLRYPSPWVFLVGSCDDENGAEGVRWGHRMRWREWKKSTNLRSFHIKSISRVMEIETVRLEWR